MSQQLTTRDSIAPLAEIRAHFPALARHVGDTPVAYFDGPGGTQVPRAVAGAVVEYLYHHNANTHWAYPTSAETDAALDHARTVFAVFLNGAPDEIVFGHNMTTLTYHVARALGRDLGVGDEIIVTELDHHGNVAPWTALERERGVTVRAARFDASTGQLDWDHLTTLVTRRTRVLAVGAASNALGTVNDVGRAVEVAHAVGALVFIDGVHLAPHRLPDVHALGCDFFVLSAYKMYGPHVGVLYGRRELIESLDFPRLLPASQAAPERAETGTLNHEGIVGAAAAVEWLGSLATGGALRERLGHVYAELDRRGRELTARLWEGLSSIDGITLFGPPPDVARTPTVGFTVAGHPAREVSRRLADRGIFCSHGDFYAQTVVDRLRVAPEGLVRAGAACYTTPDEVTRLVDGVESIAVRGRGA